jgi:LysR family transcriptional regulator, hydrogen peroxide-inducible genes activator
MEIQQIRYFVKLAELGNFTRAAEACGVSQPSLSQQVSKLELELGQPLVERLGRGTRLTGAGVRFKERADQIIRLVDDAAASVIDEPDAGHLTLAGIPTIAPFFLPAVLDKLARLYPKAQLTIREETTQETLHLLAEGEIDLAVLAMPIKQENLHVESIFTEELKVVMNKSHPLADKPKIGFKDLASERFVLLHEAHCLTGTTMAFCQRHAFSPLVTARIHQLTMVQELVRLGHGISMIPEMAAKADSSPDRVYRSLTGDKPTRTIALAWNRMRFQTKLFVNVVNHLRAAAPRVG